MKLKIKQKRSAIGRSGKEQSTVVALGIKKMKQEVIHEDSPQIRGMIRKITHLVEVEEIDV